MMLVENLSKDYADLGGVTHALRRVSFQIQKGEFIAIMGPSGSGKSTLLHILSFLDRPSEGTYTFFGKSIEDFTDEDLAHVRNEEIGFVFQSFNLLARSTVYQNVEVPLLYSVIPVSKRKSLVEGAVKSVGLEDKLHTEAGRLSGGQKQRVAIARSLVGDPNVIFADEPTGNLDSESGGQIMEILEKLNRAGRTIILVTHETYTAGFAHRLIHLKDGMVESDTTVKDQHRAGGDFFK